MLVNAMSLLLVRLNQYIHQADGNPLGTDDPAIMGNISQVDSVNLTSELENKIVLSLVNISEEAALRNNVGITKNPGGSVSYRNPSLYINLCFLFTANYTNYNTSIRRLSQIFAFFQSEKTFRLSDSTDALSSIARDIDITLHMDLISLNYEDVNNLWGSLGGKQLPFAMYRGRLLELREQGVTGVGGRIEQIDVRGRGKVL